MKFLKITVFIFAGFSAFAIYSQAKDPYGMPEVEERYKALETFARGMFYLETLYVDPTKVNQSDMVANALKGIETVFLRPPCCVLPESCASSPLPTQGQKLR